jgi:polyisoprenoid-binding protein YceI
VKFFAKIPAVAVALSAACAVQAAEVYSIEPNHTSATFEFTHLGLSTFVGKFPKASGTVTLDAAKKQGNVDITFDVKAVSTGVSKFDEHLRSADFFEVSKFPTATFKSTAVEFAGDQIKTVRGNLTLKGTTKPVVLEVTSMSCKAHPMLNKPACGANAKTTIKRSEFGLGAYVPNVSDEIPLRIEIEAIKNGA